MNFRFTSRSHRILEVGRILRACACISALVIGLLCCRSRASDVNTNAIVFQSASDMLTWEEHSSFTNGFEMIYRHQEVESLPTNFITEIAGEIIGPNLRELIMLQPAGSQPLAQNTNFAVAICSGEDVGFSIRANYSLAAGVRPPWLRRLEFYLDSRFRGHTVEFVTEAIKEEAGATNCVLPFGFSSLIKQKYWIPSKRIEEDTLELDGLTCGLAQDKGLIKPNQIWLVRDGPFAWIYWLDFGMPLSQ